MKVTFINEIADLCEKAGANVQDVARGIGLDKRIGSKFLHAGPGYGGSCLPKDTQALIKTAQDHGTPVRISKRLPRSTRASAPGARFWPPAAGGRGKTIAVLGLTFKPNTDDLRIARDFDYHHLSGQWRANSCLRSGRHGSGAPRPRRPHFFRPLFLLRKADALVIVTEWDAFRALDLDRIKSARGTGHGRPPEHLRSSGNGPARFCVFRCRRGRHPGQKHGLIDQIQSSLMAVGGTRSGGLPKPAIFGISTSLCVLPGGASAHRHRFYCHCHARETKIRRHHSTLIGAHGDAVFVNAPSSLMRR